MATVVIEGLSQFRADLRRAIEANPRELTKALRKAGVPVQRETALLAAATSHNPRSKHPGELAAGYRIEVRGATGNITNRAPYAGGAEWGARGKWSGFNRYGGRGERFAAKAIDEQADAILEITYEGLREIVTIYGWAT